MLLRISMCTRLCPYYPLSHHLCTHLPRHTFIPYLHPPSIPPSPPPSSSFTSCYSHSLFSLQESGWTALIWASFYGRTEAVKALLTAPDINVNYAYVSIYPLTPVPCNQSLGPSIPQPLTCTPSLGKRMQCILTCYCSTGDEWHHCLTLCVAFWSHRNLNGPTGRPWYQRQLYHGQDD